MKTKYILLITVICGWLLPACSNWLDVEPKTSVKEGDLFKNENGFKDALTGFYVKMGNKNLYSRELSYYYIELLAQRYDNLSSVYDWATVYNYDGTYEGTKNGFFSGIYNIIANINNFLFYLEKNREVITTDDYYEVMKGEALGLRAFLHFDLLRLFGPVYKTDPAASAIPYRLTFDNIPSPVLPANEVLDYILSDLHTADTLLENHDSKIFTSQSEKVDRNPFMVMRQCRMNTYAVKALLARVYCYKGDSESKAKAYQYAQEIIELPYFNLAESNASNRILFSEHIFSLHVYELKKIVDEDFANISFGYAPGLSEEAFKEMFESAGSGTTDFRSNTYAFNTRRDGGGGESKKVLAKYEQSDYYGNYDGAELVPLIRLVEMYYILAECDPSPVQSAEWLNQVRLLRGIPGSDALDGNDFDRLDTRSGYDNTQTVRTNEVMKEYMKEFYGEGQLFYYYKKHNYKTFYNCPLEDVRSKYKIPLPDDELIFGTTK